MRDKNNVAVQGATVTFSASAGTLTVTQGTTDATGTATATLSASGAAAGTNITVTATAGGASGQTTVAVVAAQETITLETSSPQIASDGSAPATITALVRGASNQLLSGVNVTFAASSGGIGPGAVATGSSGSAQATLSTAGDPTNRTITVTATAGSANATIAVSVVGTKLTLTGPATMVNNSQATYTVALADSSGNGISGKTVTIQSASGNTLSPTTAMTDSTGHATFQMTASKSGTDTLTASALGMTSTQTVTVSGQSFTFTTPAANTNVDINANQTITVQWTSNGSPQVGQTVQFATTRGTFSGGTSTVNATTDGNGNATATISSTSSGPALITASASGVTSQLDINFLATTPTQISLQASPTVIAISGQSTITVVVRDAENNLVADQTVDFQLTDPTGGSLSIGTAVTDEQGVAETVYTASTTASGSNGVVVTASIPGSGVAPQTVDLTVGGQALFLSMGTGNTIQQLPAGCVSNGGTGTPCTAFSVPFYVQAVDAAGNAVDGVTIDFTVLPINYAKGYWWWNGTSYQQDSGGPVGAEGTEGVTVCANEDVDYTGIYSLSKDTNGNGRLDPGDVAAVSPGSVQTANGGFATVNVTYPQSDAMWVEVVLTATTTVQGTQSSTSSTFWLPILASDLTSQSISPPGPVSPYGIATDCTNPN